MFPKHESNIRYYYTAPAPFNADAYSLSPLFMFRLDVYFRERSHDDAGRHTHSAPPRAYVLQNDMTKPDFIGVSTLQQNKAYSII